MRMRMRAEEARDTNGYLAGWRARGGGARGPGGICAFAARHKESYYERIEDQTG